MIFLLILGNGLVPKLGSKMFQKYFIRRSLQRNILLFAIEAKNIHLAFYFTYKRKRFLKCNVIKHFKGLESIKFDLFLLKTEIRFEKHLIDVEGITTLLPPNIKFCANNKIHLQRYASVDKYDVLHGGLTSLHFNEKCSCITAPNELYSVQCPIKRYHKTCFTRIETA